MKHWVSYNGKLILKEDLRIPFSDRAFLFGDGVFTTMHVNNGIVENFGKHMLRLKQNCLSINITPQKITTQWIKDLVIANNALEGSWRMKLIVTGGISNGLGLEERHAGDIIITLAKCTAIPVQPFNLSVFPFPVVSPTAKVKSLAYLDRLWIKDFALKNGTHDALTKMENGTLLETAFSNIFWINESTFYTPSSELPLLWGTFLSSLLEGTKNLGMRIVEVREVLENVAKNSRVYICNSLMGVQPVDYIGNIRYNRDTKLEESLQRATEKVIAEDVLVVC